MRAVIYILLLSSSLSIAAGNIDRAEMIRHRLMAPDDREVLVAAHRGDWRNACENSLEAIKSAFEMGVDIVEIDLARTKDGELILMHDETLDRTTTGTGKVSDHTLAEIKELRLRNGCHIRTVCEVPTLREALQIAKGRGLLNLDKAFDYFAQVCAILEETGSEKLVILKGDAPAAEVKAKYGKWLEKIIYMPKVNLDDADAVTRLDDFLRILRPAAVEFKFAADSNRLPFEIKRTMAGKSRIWYNTLWDNHAGGHDDDRSLKNPAKGYGYLIDSLGATIIQTDRPAFLIEYLQTKSTSGMLDCNHNWDYLRTENESHHGTSPYFSVSESFLRGKKNSATNEDGIVVTPWFAAVIDGATAKSDLSVNGKKSGRLAMELISEAIQDFPPDIDVTQAVRSMTEQIYRFYVDNDLLETVTTAPEKRLTAQAVIYSHARNEVWQIGDCQCLIGNMVSSNEKEIDRILANFRSVVNELALLKGATLEELTTDDVGRHFIYPVLQDQALLQNCADEKQAYAFPVLDGFPVNENKVLVFPAGDKEEIILASDGYPHLFPTLMESECYLKYILKYDPLCMRLYKSTKGIAAGNISFDDRAYLKIHRTF